jgi:hypothetical protein
MPSFSSAENACTTPSSRSTFTTTLLPALDADDDSTGPLPLEFSCFFTVELLLFADVDVVDDEDDLSLSLLLLVFVDLLSFVVLVDVDDDVDLWCFFSFFAPDSPLIVHSTKETKKKKKKKKKKKNFAKNECCRSAKSATTTTIATWLGTVNEKQRKKKNPIFTFFFFFCRSVCASVHSVHRNEIRIISLFKFEFR